MTARVPECHPDRRHKAFGLCVACYQRRFNAARSPEYRAWSHARTRTTNPNYVGFRNYGGRGIRMCEPWLRSFDAFFQAVGPKPGPGYSLDRVDNDGDYAPGNVRWADRFTQARNRRPRNPQQGMSAAA